MWLGGKNAPTVQGKVNYTDTVLCITFHLHMHVYVCIINSL